MSALGTWPCCGALIPAVSWSVHLCCGPGVYAPPPELPELPRRAPAKPKATPAPEPVPAVEQLGLFLGNSK